MQIEKKHMPVRIRTDILKDSVVTLSGQRHIIESGIESGIERAKKHTR